MISVRNVTFDYPGVRALEDVSFDIQAASITALTGPNGAGKTTLLRCIAALDQPLQGQITVDGIDVIDEPRACHRRIGYLSDFFGLYTRLSVAQGLRYVASAQGVPAADIEQRVDAAIRAVRMDTMLNRPAGMLSRGQRQRVAIAQAIVHQPKVLLLDEPASGLDPESREELAKLLKTLGAGGMTIVVSSHILAELSGYCSDLLIMRAGRLHSQRSLTASETEPSLLDIQLATASQSWPDTLAAIPGVSIKDSDERSARFSLDGDEFAQAALLKSLIDAGLQISTLSPVNPDLQRQYLDSLEDSADV